MHILIVGHSHVQAFASALQRAPRGDVEVLNFLTILAGDGDTKLSLAERTKAAAKVKAPDTICLCISGNEHNVLGLLDHPDRFSVGEATEGAAPLASDRWFVPYNVMLDTFRDNLAGVRHIILRLYEAFPGAKRLYVNAPPPISDWEHIVAHPGIFKDMLHLGPAPDRLKLQLYDIQTQVLREICVEAEAKFIEPPQPIRDQRGFLGKLYHSADPTHGNHEYGALVLKEILSTAGAPA